MKRLRSIFFVLLCSASFLSYAQPGASKAKQPPKSNSSKKAPPLKASASKAKPPPKSSATTKASTLKKLPRQLKGYDLRAWYHKGKWRFTLLPGTNCMKKESDFTSQKGCMEKGYDVKIMVTGKRAFDALMRRFPEGAYVSFAMLRESDYQRPIAERQELRNIFKRRCVQGKLKSHFTSWLTLEEVRKRYPRRRKERDKRQRPPQR